LLNKNDYEGNILICHILTNVDFEYRLRVEFDCLGAMSSEQTHCFKQTRVFDMWFLQARAQTLANR